jgi:hypothetical protein
MPSFIPRIERTVHSYSIATRWGTIYIKPFKFGKGTKHMICNFNISSFCYYDNYLLSWAYNQVRQVGLEVLTAVVMKSTIFWDITPRSLLKVNRRFGGTYRLHLHGWRISRARNQRKSRWQAEFCLPPAGDDMFLRNVCWLSTDSTALYPRR